LLKDVTCLHDARSPTATFLSLPKIFLKVSFPIGHFEPLADIVLKLPKKLPNPLP
jgi:hypothetical protein